MRALSGAALLLAASLLSPDVHASPSFPAALRDAVKMSCAPPCTVCHTVPEGGSGTGTKPFAVSMVTKGKLSPKQSETVAPAVQALLDNNTDSNGDGIGDIDQLKKGFDPNIGNIGIVCGPAYGCGARVASHRTPGPGAGLTFALALALGIVFVGRRRRG
jgi:hypothetical protein